MADDKQLAQLKAQRVAADANGQTEHLVVIDKQLAALGVKKQAAEKRASAASDEDARRTAPKGRRGTEKTEG